MRLGPPRVPSWRRRRPAGGALAVGVDSRRPRSAEEVPADRRAADETAKRPSHAATALAAFSAGLTAATTLRRLAGHRLPVVPAATTPLSSVAPSPDYDAVVLPFARPVAEPARQLLESPARCGDSGGLTKAGAPCGARATSGSRCHHHPMAA